MANDPRKAATSIYGVTMGVALLKALIPADWHLEGIPDMPAVRPRSDGDPTLVVPAVAAIKAIMDHAARVERARVESERPSMEEVTSKLEQHELEKQLLETRIQKMKIESETTRRRGAYINHRVEKESEAQIPVSKIDAVIGKEFALMRRALDDLPGAVLANMARVGGDPSMQYKAISDAVKEIMSPFGVEDDAAQIEPRARRRKTGVLRESGRAMLHTIDGGLARESPPPAAPVSSANEDPAAFAYWHKVAKIQDTVL